MVRLMDYTSVLSHCNSDADTRLCSWCEICHHYNAEELLRELITAGNQL